MYFCGLKKYCVFEIINETKSDFLKNEAVCHKHCSLSWCDYLIPLYKRVENYAYVSDIHPTSEVLYVEPSLGIKTINQWNAFIVFKYINQASDHCILFNAIHKSNFPLGGILNFILCNLAVFDTLIERSIKQSRDLIENRLPHMSGEWEEQSVNAAYNLLPSCYPFYL